MGIAKSTAFTGGRAGVRPVRPSGATGRSAAPPGDAAKERAAAEQRTEDTLAAVQLGSGAAPRGVPKDEPAAARGRSDPAAATTTGATASGATTSGATANGAT